MYRTITLITLLTLITLCNTGPARAEGHLELGLEITPAVISDDAYEAFSDENATNGRIGFDLRYEVFDLSGFHFVPFVGYRYGSDGANPMQFLETTLGTHDFVGGLRVRRGLLSFLGAYADVFGGAQLTNLETSLSGMADVGFDDFETASNYSDRVWTWQAGGLAGFELYFPRSWMKQRGIERFTFGGEIGAGYVWRGTTTLEPTLDVADEQALPITEIGQWGELNQSAFVFQIGLTARFY